MAKRHYMFLLLVCVMGIFLVASASASDFNETSLSQTDDVAGVGEIDQTQEISETGESEELSVTDLENLSTDYAPSSSSEIQTDVDDAGDGDTIVLDGYYLLNSTINVNKKLNFVGKNNATVDGNNAVQLFNVSTSGVTFENITFKNGYFESKGGAIYFSSGGSVVNCYFTNNFARSGAGAIYKGNAINCTFNNNSGVYGGALYGGNVLNSIFINNVGNFGGAIYSGNANNCTFRNNTAKGTMVRNGAAIYETNATGCIFISNFGAEAMNRGSAINCTFINNSPAIRYCSAIDCIFINNSGSRGGALIESNGTRCIFINNSVETSSDGGAMYGGLALNCTFINNSAGLYGALSNGIAINCNFSNNYACLGGGAIGSSSAINCIFINNTIGGEHGYCGGAIAYSSAVNCTFINNSAENSYGGAIARSSAVNCTFINNSAIKGGAIYMTEDINITDCIFKANSAEDGGAIYSFYTIDAINCNFTENTATNNGAAIYNVNANNCTFLNNSAKNYGGAVYFTGVGSVVNCSFIGNSAEYGGAVYVYSGSVVNCSFVNNSASDDGGAVYSDRGGGSVVNCMFFNNSASDYGGAVYFRGGGSVVNCSFIGNSAGYRGGAVSGGSVVNCMFFNNSASDYGGAVYFGNGGSVVNCSFVGNSAGYRGGAVYFFGSGCSVVNCNFTNNQANGKYSYGGAMYGGSAVNCSFVSNSASYMGGAMDDCSAVNCSFVNNSATYASAMDRGSAVNCTFKGHLSNVLYDTSDVLDCLFDVYPTVRYHYTTILDVTDLVSTVGEDGFLNVTVSDIRGPTPDKTVNITIGDTQCPFKTNQFGQIRVNIKDYLSTVGKHVLNVNVGDEINDPAAKNVTVIMMSNSILNVGNLSVEFNDDGFLVANLSDIRGPLANRIISFNIAGKKYNFTTDSKGSVKLSIRDYISESGEYFVNVNYDGEELVNPCSNDAYIILKYCSVLDCDDLSIVKGDESRLSVALSNENGPLTGKSIVFNVNGKNISVPTISNVAYLKITDYLTEIGDYTVGIAFNGDEFNSPAFKTINVHINYYEGNLSVVQIGKYYNDTVLMFNLTNSKTHEGVPYASIRLSFSKGENLTLTTDANGLANYSVPFSPDTYSFEAKVTDSHVDVNDVAQDLEINEIRGEIEITQNGTGYDQSDLLVKLYNPNNGDVFRNIKVNILFNTSDSDEIVTNDEGVAIYHIPFIPGTYHVLAYVMGNEYTHFDNAEKDDIVILKSDADVTLGSDIIFAYGDVGRADVTVVGGNVDGVFVVGFPDASVGISDGVISVTGLGVGHYVLNITVQGDDYHNSISKTFNITVLKTASSITGEDIVFDYGSSATVTFTVIGGSVGNVSVVGYDGKATFEGNTVTVSGLDAGNYKLEVVISPDSAHSSVTKLFNITVNRIDSSVTGGDIVFDYLSSGSAVLNVAGGSISSVNVVGYDGKATLDGNVVTVSGLNAGNYTLQVKTSPDANHNAITDTNIKIIVNKIDSSVIGDRITFDYGGSGFTTVTVVGGTVSRAEIVGYSGKTRVEGNKVMVSDLDAGDYTLQITTAPYSNYNSVNGLIDVSVNRVDGSFNFAKNLISFTSDSYGSVSLENVVGGSFNPSNMSVLGSSAEISYIDDGNVVMVSNLAKGDYYLIVTLIPDANHNSVTKTIPVKVTNPTTPFIPGINLPSTLEIAPITFYYGGSGSSDVTVAGGTVEPSGISIDGHPEVKPDLVGNKIVVSGLAVGSYTLRVSTTPYDGFYSVTKTVSITVKKISAAIKASSWSDYSKSTKKWTVKLVNSNTNKPLANMQVVLKVYKGSKLEKTLKYKTNSKGEISLKPSSWSVGKRTVKISFTKTGYECKSVSKTVNVLKQTKVKYTVKTVPRKDGTSVSIWIKIGKKPIKKGVKFNIYVPKRKKPVTVVTGTFNKVNKGFVGYGTNLLSAGTHKITIKPVGFKYTGSKTIKIKIKKGANKYKKSETIISKGKKQTIYNG